MSEGADVLPPFGDEFDYVEGELGEMVELVGEVLEFGFAQVSFPLIDDHFDLIALDFILFLFLLSLLRIESFLRHMQVLIDVFHGEIG